MVGVFHQEALVISLAAMLSEGSGLTLRLDQLDSHEGLCCVCSSNRFGSRLRL